MPDRSAKNPQLASSSARTEVLHGITLDGLSRLDRCGGLSWPTDFALYEPWGGSFAKDLYAAIQNTSRPSTVSAYSAVSVDIMRDMSLLGCTLADIFSARRAGAVIRYNVNQLPTLDWLLGDESLPPSIRSMDPERASKGVLRRNWKTPLRRLRRTLLGRLIPLTERCDLHSTNDIVNRLILDRRFGRPIPIYTERVRLRLDRRSPPDVRDVAAVLTEMFRRRLTSAIGEDDPTLDRAARLLERFTVERLHYANALQDALNAVRRRDRLAPALVGGTPKIDGRLLGWLYRFEGRTVARCAHGGDRAFFADPLWPATELQACNEYWVHGPGEVAAWRDRLTREKVGPDCSDLKIRTAGSPKHVSLYKRARRAPDRGPGRILFVPGLFGAEWNHGTFAFKLPDPLIADVQLSILKALRAIGMKVSVKPHPKGVLPRLGSPAAFYGPYCDEVLSGRFDPTEMDADIFVFDFPGSAWFDALTSQRGVVLVDTQNRPFERTTRPALESRVAIVPAVRRPSGGFDVDASAMLAGLDDAVSKAGCSDAFAKSFFGLNLDRGGA